MLQIDLQGDKGLSNISVSFSQPGRAQSVPEKKIGRSRRDIVILMSVYYLLNPDVSIDVLIVAFY